MSPGVQCSTWGDRLRLFHIIARGQSHHGGSRRFRWRRCGRIVATEKNRAGKVAASDSAVTDRLVTQMQKEGSRGKGVQRLSGSWPIWYRAAHCRAYLADECALRQHVWFNGNRTCAGQQGPDRHWRCAGSACPKSKVRCASFGSWDEHDVDVPDGEPGEALVRGPSLFSGYWGADRRQRRGVSRRLVPHGRCFPAQQRWNLDFVDRRKYLIKSGGENIYPAEIERVLLASPQIETAVVVRRPDARWGEVPVAFVVTRSDQLTAEDVVKLCRGQLASYKIPKDVRFVANEDIPRRHQREK